MSPVIKSLKESNELSDAAVRSRTKRRSPLRPRGLNGFSRVSRHSASVSWLGERPAARPIS